MSLTRIDYYNKDKLPNGLSNEMQKMAEAQSSRPFLTSGNAFYIVAYRQNKPCGFVEIKYLDSVAILRNIVIDTQNSESDLIYKLLRSSLVEASKHACHRVQLACKENSIPLFKKMGFHVTGTPQEGDRSHFYIMENPCPEYYIHALSTQTDSEKAEQTLILSEDSETHNFQTESQYLQLHHGMLTQARRQIWIMIDTITNPILNNNYTSQCMLRLIKRNPNAEIRLLVANDKMGAGYYNPTINLAQRLNSYIEVRTLNNTGIPFKEMVTLVDYTACIYRRSVSSMTGFANFNNPLIAARMKSSFEHHWSFSRSSVQLRRLAI